MLINFFTDIIKLINFYLSKQNFKYCFFNEDDYTFKYIEPYILKKSEKHRVLIFTFSSLDLNSDNIEILYIKNNFLREFFFIKIKIKYIYSTTPDLNYNFFKKSKFGKNKYIYLQHSPLSLTKAYNHNAFYHFDAIQAIHTFHVEEIKKFQKSGKKIKSFRSKYKVIEKINTSEKNYSFPFDVMIAPTWSTNFYNYNFYELINKLKSEKISFFLRPHPMSIKKKEFDFNFLKQNNIIIDTSTKLDFSKARNLISDYSGIFIEFMFKTGKIPYLINSKEKILNKLDTKEQTFEEVIRINICNPINYKDISNYDLKNRLKKEKYFNKEEITKYFF